jgi:hypothetical protein
MVGFENPGSPDNGWAPLPPILSAILASASTITKSPTSRHTSSRPRPRPRKRFGLVLASMSTHVPAASGMDAFAVGRLPGRSRKSA